jgi:glucuronoarabinoxylan endo-1,4-beta-xylanase
MWPDSLVSPATLNSGASLFVALARATGTTTNSLVYTSTSVEQVSAGPASFSLEQNYPNPFNPSTTLRFQVPKTGFVSLKVFDLLGREEASLVDEQLQGGTYQVKWDASGCASGMYLCTLRSGNVVESRKLALVK